VTFGLQKSFDFDIDISKMVKISDLYRYACYFKRY